MSELNQKPEKDEIVLKQQNIGWVSNVQVKKKTAYMSISRLVFVGSCLSQGNKLYSYLAEDNLGRKIILTYLDGEPKGKQENLEWVKYNTFLQNSTKTWKVQNTQD